MSQALTALSAAHGAILRCQKLSFQASPGLELSKRDLSSSSGAAYVLSKSHLLICKRPQKAFSKQCSFLVLAMQSDKNQSRIYRRKAKPQQEMNHMHINDKSYKPRELGNVLKNIQLELVTRYPEDSNEKPLAQKQRNRKHTKAKSTSIDEIIGLFNRAKSNAIEASQDTVKCKTVQNMSEAKEEAVDSVLDLLQESLRETAEKNRCQNSAVASRDGISIIQSLNGIPLSKAPHTQSMVTNGNPTPKKASHDEGNGKTVEMLEVKDKGEVKSVLEVLRRYRRQGTVEKKLSQKYPASRRDEISTIQHLKGKSLSKEPQTESDVTDRNSFTGDFRSQRPRSNYLRKSPVASQVLRQQEQTFPASCQSGENGFADNLLNVIQENKKKLESSGQSAAPHVPDTSSTAVKTEESKSLSNGFADNSLNVGQQNKRELESSGQSAGPHVPDTLSTAVKTEESKSLMNGFPDNFFNVGQESKSLMNSTSAKLASSILERMDLNTLSLSELKIIAKSRGLKGRSRLKKSDLLELVKKGIN